MASWFNEVGHEETSVFGTICNMFEEVCATRCKYHEQIENKKGDDYWPLFDEYCNNCPLAKIAIRRK